MSMSSSSSPISASSPALESSPADPAPSSATPVDNAATKRHRRRARKSKKVDTWIPERNRYHKHTEGDREHRRIVDSYRPDAESGSRRRRAARKTKMADSWVAERDRDHDDRRRT
ncbi:hypothetical protein EXIGLDRAFT_726258 [Exidia glandulosa HHB12029]|uniref:Uncharacterized protein n=1 Tax=Exidia glandulosa HHB12029 TaxID=1314781 RepID=A0A165DTZ8_EXIGL|nr:hypothetical protein EXIGLDRAFT_726258 [Exidia glandulosa HHB12029]